VLKKFEKWLKPPGKLIILEHIHAQNKPNRLLQNMLNPVWKFIGDSCHLNRDTDIHIKEAGFKVESEHCLKSHCLFTKLYLHYKRIQTKITSV